MCESGANEFSDDMKSAPPDSRLRRLNGIMVINSLMGFHGGPSNVEFSLTKYPWRLDSQHGGELPQALTVDVVGMAFEDFEHDRGTAQVATLWELHPAIVNLHP